MHEDALSHWISAKLQTQALVAEREHVAPKPYILNPTS